MNRTERSSTRSGDVVAIPAWLVALIVVGAGVVTYRNSLHAPFIFDDHPAITENLSIRQLATSLAPPANGSGVTGRPLLNLTFALNFAAGGEGVWGYHATNLAIHLLAGLTLFGLVRRTLLQASISPTLRRDAPAIAAVTATLWTLHPLQTESVTCIVQRTESLVALFYLLAVYGFIRAVEPGGGRGWWLATVGACFAGVATKEVMVTAPVVLLLYDRTFVAGSFQEAWRRRRWLHVGSAASWFLLAWLVIGQGGSRANTAGAAVGATVWSYLLTQCRALVRYLELAGWPQPLVLDYDTRLAQSVAEVWPAGLVVMGLMVATAVALWRRPRWGFVGAWFFCILAPSSSFVPLLAQPVAEHRMYLPLAAVLGAAVVVVFQAVGRRALLAAAALAMALGATTARRNHDYRSAEAIWRDTVAKQPLSARAHFYLGHVQETAGRFAEAIAGYEAAIGRHPGYAEAHGNLGRVLGVTGNVEGAVEHLEKAVRLNPRLRVARKNLGLYLPLAGRAAEAVAVLEALLRETPDDPDAHTWLGDAWLRGNRPAAAIPHYAAAVRLQPAADKAETNWGAACLMLNQAAEAHRHLTRALALNADNVPARRNLGLACRQLGRNAEAVQHFEGVLRAAPNDVVALEQLTELRPGLRR